MRLLLRQSINILILLNHKVLGRKPEYVYRALVALAGGFWSMTAPENTTNWLPVGDGGFHLYMRIYTPDMDALETWTAPTITEIDPSKAN